MKCVFSEGTLLGRGEKTQEGNPFYGSRVARSVAYSLLRRQRMAPWVAVSRGTLSKGMSLERRECGGGFPKWRVFLNSVWLRVGVSFVTGAPADGDCR